MQLGHFMMMCQINIFEDAESSECPVGDIKIRRTHKGNPSHKPTSLLLLILMILNSKTPNWINMFILFSCLRLKLWMRTSLVLVACGTIVGQDDTEGFYGGALLPYYVWPGLWIYSPADQGQELVLSSVSSFFEEPFYTQMFSFGGCQICCLPSKNCLGSCITHLESYPWSNQGEGIY